MKYENLLNASCSGEQMSPTNLSSVSKSRVLNSFIKSVKLGYECKILFCLICYECRFHSIILASCYF